MCVCVRKSKPGVKPGVMAKVFVGVTLNKEGRCFMLKYRTLGQLCILDRLPHANTVHALC